MGHIVGLKHWTSALLFLTPVLVQCGGTTEVIDISKLAEDSESPYVRECHPSDYPSVVTSTQGESEVRVSLEELNLEFRCTLAAWNERVESLTLVYDSKRRAAEEQRRVDLILCALDRDVERRERCGSEALAKFNAVQTQFDATNLEEFDDVCASLARLVALAEIYPDSVLPRSLTEILTLGDETGCSSR